MGKVGKLINGLIWTIKKKEMIPIIQPVASGELLKEKVALITGGSGGIGYAIAKAFIQNGCKVILAGTNEEKLMKYSMMLGEEKLVRYMVINVLEPLTLKAKVAEASKVFDENRIDILVNCAGVNTPQSFFEITEDIYDNVMDINAKGTYFMSQAVADFMISHKCRGHILNVSSASALRPASTPYQVSKWAVRGMTLGFADELLPYGIIVNAIAPGPVATPMLNKSEGESIFHPINPSGRFATPEEIASLATFMVSGAGDLIVGDSFYITGGGGTVSLHK